jgi:hypothetical protein
MDPPHTAEDVHRVAQSLATALDRDDFIEAARFLATDCIYETGTETKIGSAAILASYAGSSTWGRQRFDELRYQSEVGVPSGDTVAVTYVDDIAVGGRRHTYRCRQHLTVNAEGRIGRIVHEELAGEREALDRFFAECGVVRPGS